MSTAKELKPYQQRVVDEKQALDEKIVALNNFLKSPISSNIAIEEKVDMTEQLELMVNYSLVLARRIKRF